MWLKLYEIAISSGLTYYNFNHVPLLNVLDSRAKSVEHMGLVRCILWIDIFLRDVQ